METNFLVEESDDIAYVRSVRSLNYDMSHASFPNDYRVRLIISKMKTTKGGSHWD